MSKRNRTANKRRRNYSHITVTPQVETTEECLDDPLAEQSLRIIQTEQTNSDCEDFLGFEATDINSEIVNASTGEVFVIFQGDGSYENHLPPEDELNVNMNQSDDDLMIVENNVEVIEIEDDGEEDETPPPPPLSIQSRKLIQYSLNELQQMVLNNHPEIEFHKPNLNWKSDHIRLIFLNGIKQNACVCTKCLEVFTEINIDTLVKHSRCIPPPTVPPFTKRSKTNKQGSTDSSQISKYGISKIQTIAACIDLQNTTLYQSDAFLNFAKFLINTGATTSNHYKPRYDDLWEFSNQLKGSQQSRIRSILNSIDEDFSFSCDVWNDICQRQTNIALELHYLDSNFSRHRIVIGVRTINGINIDDESTFEQIVEILKMYSNQDNEVDFLEKAIAFVTPVKIHIPMKKNNSFPSACGIINSIANEIVEQLDIMEMCIQIVALVNLVSSEKISKFDGRKWENVYELLTTFQEKKTLIIEQKIINIFPNELPIMELLEPFHMAIRGLDDSKNNVTKVYVIHKCLANHLTPQPNDNEILKTVKAKALNKLMDAFADSDFYQICMFLDPFNRKHYDSLESDKMDDIQSKVDALINTTPSDKIDLLEYMDDNVITKPNEIDLFLQCTVLNGDIFEYWRDSVQIPELKKLARKYLTIPTYASIAECTLNKGGRQCLINRNNLETKDLETIMMMNSFHLDGNIII